VQGEYFGLGASSVNPPFAASSIAGRWFTAVGLMFVTSIGSHWRSTASDVNLNPDFWTIAPG
jgi:hypothetical protein